MGVSRRGFLGTTAVAVGGMVVAERLRFFDPLSSSSTDAAGAVLTGTETVYRTGHSNNCDGACGHLVHVVDGRVSMIGPAGWGTTTVSGAAAPTFNPRICARGLSQISNTYSPIACSGGVPVVASRSEPALLARRSPRDWPCHTPLSPHV